MNTKNLWVVLFEPKPETKGTERARVHMVTSSKEIADEYRRKPDMYYYHYRVETLDVVGNIALLERA